MFRIAIAIGALTLLSSCTYFDVCESVRQGEVRFEYPRGRLVDTSPVVRPERLSLPQKCAHLYDPGNTDVNSPWKVCMGVGAK